MRLDMKSLLQLSFFSLFFFLITSCGQNRADIREELVSLTPCELQEKLNLLSARELCELWRYKMDNTLKSKNLSDEEKEIIRHLESLLTKENYEDHNDDATAIIDQVTEVLKEKFGWNEEKLYKYLGTVLTEEEVEENIRRGKNRCSPSE